jgi:hypothetical protein
MLKESIAMCQVVAGVCQRIEMSTLLAPAVWIPNLSQTPPKLPIFRKDRVYKSAKPNHPSATTTTPSKPPATPPRTLNYQSHLLSATSVESVHVSPRPKVLVDLGLSELTLCAYSVSGLASTTVRIHWRG